MPTSTDPMRYLLASYLLVAVIACIADPRMIVGVLIAIVLFVGLMAIGAVAGWVAGFGSN